MSTEFASTFSDLHLLKHPFYQAWMQGRVSREQLRDYARQYFTHVDHFPRYLSAMHANCETPEIRRALLDNLMEEEGVGFGVSHPELWLRFAAGLGETKESVRRAEPRDAIRTVVETFSRAARSSLAEGLGALYAYESQVPEVAESKIEGLKKHYGIDDPEMLAFFEVHKTADVGHREAIEKMIAALSPEEREKAAASARGAAQALWNFLSEVYGPEHERASA